MFEAGYKFSILQQAWLTISQSSIQQIANKDKTTREKKREAEHQIHPTFRFHYFFKGAIIASSLMVST